MHALSLLVVALFIFDVSFVTARPRHRRSLKHVAVLEGLNLNTNAKRLAAGLPPLPPVRRYVASKVDTARRQTPSLCSEAKVIEVRDDKDKTIGWLADDLKDGHFTLTGSKGHANVFTANLGSSGTTYPVNFKDSATTDNYLAGLISPGTTLTSTSGLATLGLSSQVSGPPQVNNPSISGHPSETAIWSYDSSTKSVTGIWIDQSSASISLFIWHDKTTGAFHLTGSSTAPTSKSERVTFKFD